MSHIDGARGRELLGRAAGVRVLVVGDLMLDRYVSGRVERVSPEAPVPVLLVQDERTEIGGAANVAANVAALGPTCAVIGCLGHDPEGEQLLAGLAARGIDASAVTRVAGRPTTLKTRVHDKQQQIVRIDREVDEDVEMDVATELAESVRALAPSSDAVVVQDYNKGVLTPQVITTVLESAREAGVPLVVDPKRRSFFDFPGATVFKPNRRELEDALGACLDPDDEPWMEETRRRIGCRHLLLTLGDEGMALQTEDGELVRMPAAAQEVYDVSGAGDTVSAAVAVALAAGATVREAAALANHAAAVEVRRHGVRAVTAGEVEAHVRTFGSAEHPRMEAL